MSRRRFFRPWDLAFALLATACATQAPSLSVPVHAVDEQGVGVMLGQISLSDSAAGLRIEPSLAGLPPGPHGFHVHEKPSCAMALKDGRPVAALAAGPHFDPQHSGHHAGPHGQGHLGDLPVLQVDADGRATQTLLAPRLRLQDVLERSLIIHAGGDTLSDHPASLGGGGARIACGLILGRPQPAG